MHFYSKTIFILFVIIILKSCKSENDLEEINNIGRDIEISLSQNVTFDGPNYELQISTIDSINCKNTLLETYAYTLKGKLYIDVIGLKDDYCENGQSKPIATESLHQLKDEMQFSITIKEAYSTSGLIINNGKEAKLSLNNNESLRIKNSEVKKIEQNTFWGEVICENNEQLNQFKELLKTNTNQSFKPVDGNYGLFDYFLNKVYFTKPTYQTAQPYYFTFYIQYENWEDMKEKIESFLLLNPLIKINSKNSNAISLSN